MKWLTVTLGITCSIALCTVAQARDQKIIFNTERFSFAENTLEQSCRDTCLRLSSIDVDEYLDNGWKIVNSMPKEKIGEEYLRYSGTGCTCTGTQYVVEKKNSKTKEPPALYRQ